MNDINIELFKKYPEKSFRLIAVLDIDLKYPNYFYVIFEDIETNVQHREYIIPELFRRKFKIGNIYRNNQLIRVGNYLEDKFQINVQHVDKYQKFEDVIANYPYELNEYNAKFLNKQLCYVYEVENSTLIVPSNIIAIRYYFLSSSFKKAYNDGDLTRLYHQFTDKYFYKDDKFQIDLKKTNKKDIPFLCRFLNNKYAYDSFTYFFKNKVATYNRFKKKKEESIYNTLLCRFPIIGTYNIHCRYFPLESTKDEKKVYLVTDIYNDESPLGFSSLHIRKYKQGTPQGEIDNIPYSQKMYIGRKKGVPVDNTAVHTNPTGEIIPTDLTQKAQKDLNTIGLKITNENMYTGEGKAVEINTEEVNTVPTFEEPNILGYTDEKIQQVLCKEIESLTSPFLLSHFMILFEELRQEPNVLNSRVSSIQLMLRIPNKRKKGFNDKSLLNKDENTPRPYLYGYMQYNDKFLYFIEIQEDSSWSQSTWFFVSDIYFDINNIIVNDIIKKYIHSLGYLDLYEYCFNRYQLSLFTKKHTKNIYSEEHIEVWCEEVLKLTNLTDEERVEKFKKNVE